MSSMRSLIVVLLVLLAGCATPQRPPVARPVVVPESTWRQIDREIVAVSLDAKAQATHFAQDSMRDWMNLVYKRTDAVFIPWFSSYWTRKWLSMKVTWYKMDAGGDKEQTVERLAIYLQEQYRYRVLKPVAREVDPSRVMEQATKLYIWLLGELLGRIPQRYGVPADQFNRRLKGIPAIALAPPATHSASLHQIIHAEPVSRLPAYVALVSRIRNIPGSPVNWSSNEGISLVVKRTSESLTKELATSSVASAVSTAVGRAAGMVISLGAMGVSAMLRESERPAMEAQLRKNLKATFDAEWRDLMRNSDTGVLAGVYYISAQVEGSLANGVTRSGRSERLSGEMPRPGEQPLQLSKRASE